MQTDSKSIPISVANSSVDAQYAITVGSGVLSSISSLIPLEEYSAVAVITDSNIAKHWLKPLKAALGRMVTEIVLDSGEQAKHIRTVEKVWDILLAERFDRKSLVLNLGGGVIGDLGGFAASTYMRGIDFVQIPTTLLSQVDASVGGKVGVNHAGVKNILGSFAQPISVIADVDLLSTLPQRELCSGFAEVLKHGFIRSTEYLSLSSEKASNTFSAEELISIIDGSCRIKAEIVEADEREQGLRKILNFGHTAGHALESVSHKGSPVWGGAPLLHGEAISLGMLVEARISEQLQMISNEEYSRVYQSLTTVGLPVVVPCTVALDAVFNTMTHDKKNISGEIRWTLLNGLGDASFDNSVDRRIVEEAFSSIVPE